MTEVRGESEGHWLLKLLAVGFGDGIRCSRSLLCGLPPPTRLCSSLGVDRTERGSILMVKDGEDGVGPSVVTVGEVESPLVRGVLLGDGVE